MNIINHNNGMNGILLQFFDKNLEKKSLLKILCFRIERKPLKDGERELINKIQLKIKNDLSFDAYNY